MDVRLTERCPRRGYIGGYVGRGVGACDIDTGGPEHSTVSQFFGGRGFVAVFVDGADDDGTLEVVFAVGEAGGEFGDETWSIYSKQHPHHQSRTSFALQITREGR